MKHWKLVLTVSLLVPLAAPAQMMGQSGVHRPITTTAAAEAVRDKLDFERRSPARYVLTGAAIGAGVGVIASIVLNRGGGENYYGVISYLIPPVVGAAVGAGVGALIYCCRAK